MTQIVTSKIELLETLLRELMDAAYSTVCESNGVSDNEWTITDGKAVPEWPVQSFCNAIHELGKAHAHAKAYFDPIEAEKREKWANACATAAYVVDRFKEDRTQGRPRADSSLQRNIADAINGNLVVTEAQRIAGIQPETMTDRLNQLLANGDLVELKPEE